VTEVREKYFMVTFGKWFFEAVMAEVIAVRDCETVACPPT
jgi:hypothetical protein